MFRESQMSPSSPSKASPPFLSTHSLGLRHSMKVLSDRRGCKGAGGVLLKPLTGKQEIPYQMGCSQI